MQHSLLNSPSRRIKVALATAPTVTTSLKAALLLFNGSFRAPTSFRKAGKLRCLLLEKVIIQSYNSKMMGKISTWESYDVELEKTLLPKYCLQPMRSFRNAPVPSSALPWGIHRFPWNFAGGTWDREGRQSQIPKMLHRNTSSGSSAF